jgi:N6-adenosine-specific RNA methylase IME4
MCNPRSIDGETNYPVLSLKRIAQLPVEALAAPQCHLYCWCPVSFVPHAIWLCEHWGFTYSSLLTWVKPGGVGWTWWCTRTEHIVFGFKGKMTLKNRPIDNVFAATAQKHSRKPEVSFEVIERASFPPYLELFARRKRPGWHSWGNQVDSDIDFIL